MFGNRFVIHGLLHKLSVNPERYIIIRDTSALRMTPELLPKGRRFESYLRRHTKSVYFVQNCTIFLYIFVENDLVYLILFLTIHETRSNSHQNITRLVPCHASKRLCCKGFGAFFYVAACHKRETM